MDLILLLHYIKFSEYFPLLTVQAPQHGLYGLSQSGPCLLPSSFFLLHLSQLPSCTEWFFALCSHTCTLPLESPLQLLPSWIMPNYFVSLNSRVSFSMPVELHIQLCPSSFYMVLQLCVCFSYCNLLDGKLVFGWVISFFFSVQHSIRYSGYPIIVNKQ